MHNHPSAREAARLLGGEVHGQRVRCPGPGHSRHDRSLEVWFRYDAPGGYVCNSFAGDGWQACRDHVAERLQLSDFTARRERDPVRRPAKPTKPEPDIDQRKRISRATAIWQGAVDLRRTVAERYLNSRELHLEEDLGHVLRFHGALTFEDGVTPGMVALMRDVLTNAPCGIHRTFLDRDGRKLGRKMLGRAKGAAIKLDLHEDVCLGLHIGEGIETCLAARQLGYLPTWSLGSVGAIAEFPVLAGIEAINLLAENDSASAEAAEKCCERYELAGCEAWVCQPTFGDFNDMLRKAA